MIEVYLNGKQLEIPEDTSVGINLGLSQIEDPTSATASFTQTINVPMTASNRKIFGYKEEILGTTGSFGWGSATVYEDGVELIKGKAIYEGTSGNYYKLQIVGNDFDWLQHIKDKKLYEIGNWEALSRFVEYADLTREEREAMFFGIIEHGCWWQEVGDETIRRNWATYADLIPFVSLSAILKQIFDGYEVHTGGITNFLKRLYVTGKWGASDYSDYIEEWNSFEISGNGKNLRDIQANGATHTVVGTKVTEDNHGNEAAYTDIFDTIEGNAYKRITSETKDEYADGEQVQHTILSYMPDEEGDIAFKLKMHYNSTFIVKNGKPIFADTVHFNGMPIVQLGIEDSTALVGGVLNSDTFRSAAEPYSIAPVEGDTLPQSDMGYFYLELSNPELYVAVVQCFISVYGERSQHTFNDRQILSTNMSSKMYIKGACSFDYDNDMIFSSNSNNHADVGVRAVIGLLTQDDEVLVIGGNEKATHKWVKYSKDRGNLAREAVRIKRVGSAYMSKYKDAVVKLSKFTDDETISFDVQLLTPTYYVSTDAPLSLAVGFTSSRATELGGEELLVSVGDASLAPKFNVAPEYGVEMSLNFVGLDMQATDMLKAIMHLFALRIYTNEDTKDVYVLPYKEFYNDTIVDWSDRVDKDKGVDVSYIHQGMPQYQRLEYKDEIPAVQAFNDRHYYPYLSNEFWTGNDANNEKQAIQNPLFTPFVGINSSDIFPTSKWGSLLNAASNDTQDTLDNIDYANIPPVLVQVRGETADPSDYTQYVGTTGIFANYHQPEMVVTDYDFGTTISFAGAHNNNDDYVDGLSYTYYDKLIQLWASGKRITCYCRIEPQEIESLRKAGTSAVDFRSRFLLKINGEDIYCRLESIENYEPQNATHKCTFIFG